MPEGIAALLDLVKQHERERHFGCVVLIQRLLTQQRLGFAMPQVAGRRADQLSDFVTMLEFRAVDLDHRGRITQQDFRGGLYNASFACSAGTEE